MASSLRVGIVGTGRAGRCQARAFSQLPGVSVAALWNRTRTKAERLAADLKTPGLEVFDDWRRMIDRSRIDIVSIATDPVLRLEPFAYALAKGRHVLVEKPLASDLPEAGAMAKAARQAETVTAHQLQLALFSGLSDLVAGAPGRPDRQTARHPDGVETLLQPGVGSLEGQQRGAPGDGQP